ncbi:MAG: SNF2-related protein, partial [Bacteroidales bacterium]|nr:SNF2-related protein [Bacteroidales bacterium]
MGTITNVAGGYMITSEFNRAFTFRMKKVGAQPAGKGQWFIEEGQKAEQLISDLQAEEFTNLSELSPETYGELPEMPKLTESIRMKVEPYGFQKEGIAYSIQNTRTLIGDEPGLGKTIQAIASVVSLNAFPCLIICPSSLKLNWKEEWEKCSYEKAEILTDG